MRSFRTTYPDAYPYICAVTCLQDDTRIPESLRYAMYTMESETKDDGIYIVEDSEIDLGLTASVRTKSGEIFADHHRSAYMA